jgi:glucose 1-dehydrogenase
MRNDKRVAVVTGGSRGIGWATSQALLADGWGVVNADLAPPSAPSEAHFVRTDVSDRASVESLFAGLHRVDALVNNAACSLRGPFLEMAVADAERVLAVTFWGVFHCSQVAARRMVLQGSGGTITTVSSVHAERPYPNSTAYNGAKVAVNAMSLTWAKELAPHRIRVNCVEPGWTDTPGERAFFTEEQIREQGARLPWGRLAKPEEIAHAILYLIAAEYVTGTILKVDGGVTLP